MDYLLRSDLEGSPYRASNLAAQLWAFREEVHVGDIVVLPLKAGPYEFQRVGDAERHVRPVSWERLVPRSMFKYDLLYSFGAFMTVCRIQRNDAEVRVAGVLAGNPDPGVSGPDGSGGGETPELPDIAQAAHDEIVAFVRRKFAGHALARLIAAILEAEIYSEHCTSRP